MSNHTQAITQVKWGGDGLIYSAARDCSINVWAAADGRMVRRWARGRAGRPALLWPVHEPAGQDLSASLCLVSILPLPLLPQLEGARPLGKHNEPKHRCAHCLRGPFICF